MLVVSSRNRALLWCVRSKGTVTLIYAVSANEHTSLHSFHITFHAEDDLIPRAPTNHLTPIDPRAGGQSPDLIPPANGDQNQVLLSEGQGLDLLPGKGRGLAVLNAAVAADIDPGHNLPGPG